MKKLLLILAFATCSNALACESVDGAWYLSYAIYKDRNGKVLSETKSGSEHGVKILAQGNYSFILVNKGGKFLGAHTGSFYLKEGKYIEVIHFSSSERGPGKVYEYQCSMKDGLWIIKSSEEEISKEEHWRPARK